MAVVVAARGSATSGSAGAQTRRSATIAARLDDRRHDVRQLDRDVVRARELGDGERESRRLRATGHACLIPRRPSTMPTRMKGTISASNGVWRPTIAPSSPSSSPVTSRQRHDRDRERAERDGRRVPEHGQRGRLDRLEAERGHHGRGDRGRGAEAGQRLQQRAEAERDQHRLDALILRDRADRSPQDGEVPGLDGHVVDPDRRDDDPHDRKEAEGRALSGREDGLIHRHAVDRRGDRRSRWRVRSAPPTEPSSSSRRAGRSASGSAAPRSTAVSPSECATGSKSWV